MIRTQKLISYHNLADQQLIQCIIQNDENAIEYFFYDKCQKMFSRIIWQIFSSQVELDELIDEFYLYLQKNDWAKLKTFQGDSALITWLTVVAVRFFVNNKQRMTNLMNKDTLTIEEVANELQTTNGNNLNNSYSFADLYNAIHLMKNPRYKWVLLSELNGINPEEMAEELQTNVGNIYNLKKRAKIQLAELLNEYKNV